MQEVLASANTHGFHHYIKILLYDFVHVMLNKCISQKERIKDGRNVIYLYLMHGISLVLQYYAV